MRNKVKNRKAFIGLVLALAMFVATAVPVAYAAYIKYSDNIVTAKTMGKQEANVNQNTVNFGLDTVLYGQMKDAIFKKDASYVKKPLYVVYAPEKAGWYLVTLQGAFGQRGRNGSADAGAGGLISAYIWFNAGETIYVTVGSRLGGDATLYAADGNRGPYVRDGGFNGGGFGGTYHHWFDNRWPTADEYYDNLGGAGGGATDIRIGGTAIENRIMVSGGGGGSSGKGNGNGVDAAGLAGGNGGMGEGLKYYDTTATVTLAGNIKKEIPVCGYVAYGDDGIGMTEGSLYTNGMGGRDTSGGAAGNLHYQWTTDKKTNTNPAETPLSYDMGGDVGLESGARYGKGAFAQGGSGGNQWARTNTGGMTPSEGDGTGGGAGGGGWFGGGAGTGIGRSYNIAGGGGGGSSFIIGNHNALDTVAIKNSTFRTKANTDAKTPAVGLVLTGTAPKTYPSDLEERKVYSYSKPSDGGSRDANYWGHEGFATFSYMGEVLPYIDPATIVAK